MWKESKSPADEGENVKIPHAASEVGFESGSLGLTAA